MRIKIYTSLADQLEHFLVLLLIISEYRFFFIPLPAMIAKYNTNYCKFLQVIIAFGLIICNLSRSNERYRYRKETILMFIVFLIEAIVTLNKYPLAVKTEIIMPSITYLLIFLYYPLKKYISHNGDSFFKTYQYCNIIGCTVAILQSVLFSISRFRFIYLYEYYVSDEAMENFSRSSFMRIPYLSTAVSIAFVLALVDVFVYRKNIKLNTLSIICSFLYFLLSSQTRMYFVVCGVCVLYLLFSKSGKLKNNRLLRTSVLLFFICMSCIVLRVDLMVTEIIQPVLDGSYKNNGSYYARFEAIRYFGEKISQNPLTGLGPFRVSKNSPYYNIIRGPLGICSYSDVGLFGSLAEFGVPLIALYIFFLMKSINLNKKGYCKYSGYTGLLMVLLLTSSITLSPLDPQRFIIVPVAMAVFDQEKSVKDYLIKGLQ